MADLYGPPSTAAVTVDQEAMARAVRVLRDASDRIGARRTVLANYGAYGRPRIAAIVGDFARRWEPALGALPQAVDLAADDLEFCRRTYQEVEERACLDMSDLWGGLE